MMGSTYNQCSNTSNYIEYSLQSHPPYLYQRNKRHALFSQVCTRTLLVLSSLKLPAAFAQVVYAAAVEIRIPATFRGGRGFPFSLSSFTSLCLLLVGRNDDDASGTMAQLGKFPAHG